MFRPLDFSKLEQPPATVATTATKKTDRVQDNRNVATVAVVAGPNVDTAYAYAAEPIDLAAIEERAGLAADRVPAVYLDAWARLCHQRPGTVMEAEWRQALDDGGRFLDEWGSKAAALGWTPGNLFDVTAGLVWKLGGTRVEALSRYAAGLVGGPTLARARPTKRWDHRTAWPSATEVSMDKASERPSPSSNSSRNRNEQSGKSHVT